MTRLRTLKARRNHTLERNHRKLNGQNAMKKPKQKITTPVIIPDLKPLTLSQIAKLIVKDWGVPNYAAKPYLQAMANLSTVNDKYGLESGTSVVRYFLSNAASYRGELAKAIKAELRERVK